MTQMSPQTIRSFPRRVARGRSLALAHVRALATPLALCCLTAVVNACFLRKYVYRPVLVANAIGDSTTTMGGATLHVYKNDEYEIYGPTALSVSTAEQQVNRAYREFAKHFGVQPPPMAIIIADSDFAIPPNDAGLFAKRRIYTFVYVRPHNLRDIEGVAPDAREDEIWPVSSRVARELLAAHVAARRHLPPVVESRTHAADYHLDPLPTWYVDAVVALIGDPGAPDRIMDWFRGHLTDAPPVASLLDMQSPGAGTQDTIAGTRERRALVGAEGVALTLFLAEREGPRVVGRLADALLAGGTARQVVTQSRHVPQNDADFERVWRAWVRDEYGR
jgi:hypothetical protein